MNSKNYFPNHVLSQSYVQWWNRNQVKGQNPISWPPDYTVGPHCHLVWEYFIYYVHWQKFAGSWQIWKVSPRHQQWKHQKVIPRQKNPTWVFSASCSLGRYESQAMGIPEQVTISGWRRTKEKVLPSRLWPFLSQDPQNCVKPWHPGQSHSVWELSGKPNINAWLITLAS